MRIKTESHETFSLSNEWKRRNNKKKNSAEGRESATVHSVLECETVAIFCILLQYNVLIITCRK